MIHGQSPEARTRRPKTLRKVSTISIPEPGEEAMFLSMMVHSSPTDKVSCHALVDTGCFARLPLMSEEIWRRTTADKNLLSPDVRLTSAGNSPMRTIGLSRNKLLFHLYNPITKSSVSYRSQVYVVRNLSSPVIFGLHDLVRLNASVAPASQQFLVRSCKGRTYSFRLHPRPHLPLATFVHSNIIIPPLSETIVPVCVPASRQSQEVLIIPSVERALPQPDVMVSPVLATITNERTCYMPVRNNCDDPIHLSRGQLLGLAENIDHYHDRLKYDSSYVQAIKTTSQFQGREQTELLKSAFVPIKTEEDLRARLTKECNFLDDNHPLSTDERRRLVDTLASRREALSLDYDEIGLIKDGQVTLSIETSGPPIKQKVRPIGPHLRDSLEQQIQRWQAQSICRPSQSPWASPVLAVPKKNGGVRWVIDFRRLNLITKPDARPIGTVEDKIARLAASQNELNYFFSIDIAEAYHAVPVAEDSIEKTAFCTPLGLYEFLRAPFGIARMPSVFHEIVRLFEAQVKRISPEDADKIIMYFDDILIVGRTFEDARRRLDLSLKILGSLGLKIQPKKGVFSKESIKWLGYNLTKNHVCPDKDRIKAVSEWSNPTTHKELASLHALLSTFRKFIRNFAARSAHIRSALKRDPSKSSKSQPVDWTPQMQAEKDDIVRHLQSSAALGYLASSPSAGPLVVTVDTSRKGVGATLSQVQSRQVDGVSVDQEVILQFASRALTPGEQHYGSFKLELAGLVSAVRTWKRYLMGRQFVIRTDNRSLVYLLTANSDRLPSIALRWAAELQHQYKFTIQHIQGSKNQVADALSRRSYKPGDAQTMCIPMPIRDDFFADDMSLADANTLKDDIWIPYLKKRFKFINPVADTSSQSDSLTVTYFPGSSTNQPSPQPVASVETRAMHRLRSAQATVPQPSSESSDTCAPSDPRMAPVLAPLSPAAASLRQLQRSAEDANSSARLERQSRFRQWIAEHQRTDAALKTVNRWLCAHPGARDGFPQEWLPLSGTEVKSQLVRILGDDASPDVLSRQIRNVSFFLRSIKAGKLSSDSNGVLLVDNKVLVPESAKVEIIQIFHHSSGGNYHRGVNATIKAIEEDFVFPGITSRVRDYITLCYPCKAGKRTVPRNGPSLGQTTSVPLQPGKVFALDTCHMPKGLFNLGYILLAVDCATSFTEGWALQHANGTSVARCLRELLCRYGSGITLVVDSGPEFINQEVKAVADEFNATIYRSTPHHSQSHPAERYIRTLEEVIRVHMAEKQASNTQWPLMLQDALYTMRSARDPVTMTSPFKRLFGSDPGSQPAAWIGKPDYSPWSSPDSRVSPSVEPSPSGRVLRSSSRAPSAAHRSEPTLVNEVLPSSASSSPVASRCNSREAALAAWQEARLAAHEANRRRLDAQRTRAWTPAVDDIVDLVIPVDVKTGHSKKMANYTRGPYRMKQLLPGGKSAIIVPLDLPFKQRQVYLGDLRPSSTATINSRPPPGWRPSWLSPPSADAVDFPLLPLATITL